MRVIATAGHVDHGKSTLVRALTGIEPDRWSEEKRRGLTIDLGYAWTDLATAGGGSEQVAFVDVPGHERFITNMLAGVGPVPAVLLVVAADEGWRQQTHEHLDAIVALGIEHGVVAITRSDLADPQPVVDQTRRELAATPLAGAEVVPVSAATGEGLDQLRAALVRLCAGLPVPDAAARARLWVDRVFSVRGAGTVVTGTLGQGALAVGSQVQLPGERTATIRSLQALEAPREQVAAVARVAANLRGVAVDDLARGDAVLTGAWHLTSSADVRLRAVREAGASSPAATGRPGLELPESVMAHVGTAAVQVHVRPLDADHVRLTWPTLLPLQVGDRVILRDPGRQRVLAGATVLDADPPPLSRRGAARRRGEDLRAAPERLDEHREVQRRGHLSVDHLARLGGDPAVVATLRRGAWLVAEQQWPAWRDALREHVLAHAAAHPRQPGTPMASAVSALGLPDAALLTALARDAGLDLAGGVLTPKGVTASLGAREPALQQVEQRLATTPFNPPDRDELAALGLTASDLAIAVKLGRLLDLGDMVFVTPKVPALAMRELSRLPQPFTTSQARQALGTSRRVIIPLLEHLDRRGWTRRLDGTRRELVR